VKLKEYNNMGEFDKNDDKRCVYDKT